jgi:hypothetical protein
MLDTILKAFGRITDEPELFFDKKKKMRFEYHSVRETFLMLFFYVSFCACIIMPILIFFGEMNFNFQSVKYFFYALGVSLLSGTILICTDDYYFADLDNRIFYKCTSFFGGKYNKKLFSFDQIVCISVSGREHSQSRPTRHYWSYTPLVFTTAGWILPLGGQGEDLSKQNEDAQFIAKTFEVPFIKGQSGLKAVLVKSGPADYQVQLKEQSFWDRIKVFFF